ncbi:alpha/beta hydrolase [Desnuesiella massiliensis]|uniref:alpha/beta hydrolase n=1 Tax=Desnuesiella massiliensis TaxID=1650662 RepID=UPI0006E21430|nr:alpha/beta hydrolase-fold protein [Desnuesiella massiliensis]
MNSQFSYKVSLPLNMEEGKRYPVIYAMHGMGSNEENIISLIEELKKDFIIIGIRGSLHQGNGFAYFSIKGYGNPHRESFDKAVNSLEQFINDASKEYPIDVNNQYLLGFSQGAILSMTLALVMGNKIKGIVALSGYIPKFVKEEYQIKSVEDMSIFISHGEADLVFPLNIGKENHDFFKERSDKVSFVSYAAGHEVSLKNRNDMIKWIYANL